MDMYPSCAPVYTHVVIFMCKIGLCGGIVTQESEEEVGQVSRFLFISYIHKLTKSFRNIEFF